MFLLLLLLLYVVYVLFLFFFFFNDTATTEIYTLSLHDALPISPAFPDCQPWHRPGIGLWRDRKSTRLNSSHSQISYAVFCLKKKKKQTNTTAKNIKKNTKQTTKKKKNDK